MLLNQEHHSIIRENSRDEAAYQRIMAVFDSLARDPEANRLRQAFENSPNPLFVVGRDGRITDSNAACASLFGYQPTGQPYQDLLWTKNAALQRQVEAVFEGQSLDGVPITYRGARGQARFMLSRLYPVWDADGTVRECMFANTDITERKRREDAVRRRERFIQRLLETSPTLVYIYDLQEERNVYINRQVGHILGYTPEDIQGMGSAVMPRLIHPDDQPRLLATRRALAEAGDQDTVEFEYRIKKADGSWRWMYSRESVFMRHPDGSPRQTLGMAVDITERKQAEAAQRQQEAFFSTVVETAQEGIWIVDAALRTLYVNRRLADMLGFAPSEMLDQNLLEFLDQSGMGLTSEQRDSLCQSVLASGSARYDVEMRRRDGTPLWLMVSVTSLTDTSGQPTGYLAMVTDITERKQAEAELRAASAYHRSLIEVSVDPLVVISLDGLILDVNVAVEIATGYPRAKLLNTHFSSYFTTPEQACALQQRALETGRVKNVELALRRRDGTALTVVCNAGVYRDEEGSPQGILASLHDITERKRAEDALRQSEARNRALLEAIPDLIIRFSPDGRYVDVKSASYFQPLLPAEQLIGMNVRDVLPPDLVPPFLAYLEQVLQTGESVVYEYEIAKESGTRIYESRLVPCGDAEALSIVRDITARKHDEQALRQHSERLRQVLEEMPVMLDAFDQQLNIVFWNRECERVTGYSADEIIGSPRALEILYPNADQRARMLEVWHQVGSQFRDIEWPLTCKNGEVKIISWSNVADHWLLSGWEFWSVGIDVTERKRAEAALRESEARFRAVFDASAVGIAVGDPEGHLSFINPAFCEMLGYRDSELTGLHYSQITHPDDLPAERDLVAELLRDERDYYQMEKRFVRQDGTIFWTRISTSAIRDSDGQIQHLLALAQDITETRAAAEKALELATERERVQLVTSFIQNASHEFRTPLSIINTSVYLLERITDLENRKAQYEKINRQVKHLTTLVENLLTMSRLDTETHLNRQPTDLNDMLRQAETALQSAINQKQHRIRHELDENLPLIPADREKLHMALMNILFNAVRFTPIGGEVTLQTYRQKNEVVAAVHDTGVGISPEAVRRIFERFYREDTTHSSIGFGLGLPIAKKAVELHGGRIEVESEPGRGSVFRVVLPLNQP